MTVTATEAASVCKRLAIPMYGNRESEGMAYPVLLIGAETTQVQDFEQYAAGMPQEYRLEALYEFAGRANSEVLERYS